MSDTPSPSPSHSHTTAGLVLIVIGLIFLAERLTAVPSLDMTRLWPLILVVIGVSRLVTRTPGSLGSGATFLFLGAIFLMHTFRVFSLRDSWPLFIVAGGVSILASARACRPTRQEGQSS